MFDVGVDSLLSSDDVDTEGYERQGDNEDGHRVYRSGSPVHLTPTEYQLLRYLLWNQGRVLSKTQILDHVWPDQDERDGGVVETFIGYLRRKVDVFEPKLIHTVRGVGYTMRVEE